MLIDASRFVSAADTLKGPRGDRERSAGANPEDEDTPCSSALPDACPVVTSADAFATPREDRERSVATTFEDENRDVTDFLERKSSMRFKKYSRM